MLRQLRIDDPLRSSLTRLLLLLVFSLLIIIISMQVLFPTLVEGTQLGAIGKFLTISRSVNEDSWGVMIRAVDYMASEPHTLLYDKIFFEDHVKFQYPPSSLLLIQLVRGILRWTAILTYLLDITGWIAVFLTFVFSIQIFFLSQKQHISFNLGQKTEHNRLLIIGLLILLCLFFYPMTKAYAIGQVQTWLDALFAFACLSWLRGNKRIAGILTALMILYKPQYALILVWGLTRRQWKFVIWAGIMLLIGTSISIVVYGLDNHLNYLKALSYMSQHGESFYPNNSVNGLLNRFLFNGNNTSWVGDQFASYNPIVYYGTLISSFILVASALFVPRFFRASIFDFFLIALASTMASPIAWEHHYGIMLPMFMYLIPFLNTERPLGRFSNTFLWLTYVLCASFLPITNLLAQTQYNFLQSNLFFGALIVVAGLYIIDFRQKINRLAPNRSAPVFTSEQSLATVSSDMDTH